MRDKGTGMYNNYFDQVYSKFWTKTSQAYGMEDGLDSIIDILKNLHGKSAFEIGIGTGWPIADMLEKSGLSLAGCDISSSLIMQARQSYPDMELYTGTIWDAGIDKELKWDIVYCIRSSWYMKDFLGVIEKMMQMTNENGYIVFNIINRRNKENKKALWKNRFSRIRGRIEGSIKVLLLNRDYFASCPAFYYTKSEVESVLRKENVEWQVLSTNQLTDSRKEFEEDGQKLLFIVRKLNNN